MPLPANWPIEWLLLAALALLVAQWPLRRFGRWLVGPLFAWETVRLARRGSTTFVRVAYAAALLLTLYVSFPSYREGQWQAIADFANDFSERFLLVQSVTVLLLVPLYFGGAISDEKEKRSLDFLLTSHLTAREIILGKYFARVLSLTGVLLTGLPILALTMLWGGVDLTRVCVVFAGAIVGVFNLGALSILSSTLASRTAHATGWAILMVVFMTTIGFSPLEVCRRRPFYVTDVDVVGLHLVSLGTLGLACLTISGFSLRRRANPSERRSRRSSVLHKELPFLESKIPRPTPAPLTFWRPIGRDALLWKERNTGYGREPFVEALWLYFAGILATLSFVAFFSGVEQLREYLAGLYYGVLGLLTFGLGAGLLLHLAGTITREREWRTLEALLTLPQARGQILWAKWLGAMLRRVRWLVAIAVLLLIGLLSGTLSLAAVVGLAALILGQVTLVAALSLFVSLVSRNTVRAYVTTLVALLVLTVATGVVARSWGGTRDLYLPGPVGRALNPVMAWDVAYRLNTLRGEERLMALTSLLAASGVYVAASAGLGVASLWQFRRTERYA